jgi:hypothetical protein
MLDVAFGDELRRSVSLAFPSFFLHLVFHSSSLLPIGLPASTVVPCISQNSSLFRQRVNFEPTLPAEVLSRPAFLSSLVVR